MDSQTGVRKTNQYIYIERERERGYITYLALFFQVNACALAPSRRLGNAALGDASHRIVGGAAAPLLGETVLGRTLVQTKRPRDRNSDSMLGFLLF